MATEISSEAQERSRSDGREFSRRFCNLLCELQLHTGIHRRIENLIQHFVEDHPNLRTTYISRSVDPTYFEDGVCGWEAASRPQLQGLVVAGNNLHEFLAFSHGFRSHVTPLGLVVDIEETWLEPEPAQPFLYRACLYHQFPATTILYAPDGEMQDAATRFVQTLKYLRGF